MCRVTMGHLRVTLGHLRVTMGHLRLTKSHMYVHKGTYKYDVIKRCHPLVWGNMTHDDASVETGVGGQAKYDMMMVFCGNALQKHHNTLKSSTRRYPDCHILHILNR